MPSSASQLGSSDGFLQARVRTQAVDINLAQAAKALTFDEARRIAVNVVEVARSFVGQRK